MCRPELLSDPYYEESWWAKLGYVSGRMKTTQHMYHARWATRAKRVRLVRLHSALFFPHVLFHICDSARNSVYLLVAPTEELTSGQPKQGVTVDILLHGGIRNTIKATCHCFVFEPHIVGGRGERRIHYNQLRLFPQNKVIWFYSFLKPTAQVCLLTLATGRSESRFHSYVRTHSGVSTSLRVMPA